MKITSMFCLLATVVATPRLTVMEPDVLVGSAPNWAKLAKASSDDEVNVMFVMKHSNEQVAKLEENFWAVSDPKNPRYGQHMTQEQMVELMAPEQTVLDSVLTWINAHGVRSVDVSAHKDLIEVTMPVSEAESMFGTQLFEFEHKRTKKSLLRAASSYTLPTHIAEHVSYVANLLRLPAMDGVTIVPADQGEAPRAWDTGCGTQCAQFTTPSILAQAYKLGDRFNGTAKGSLAVSEFQGVDWDQEGLDTLSAACNLGPLTVDHQIGKNNEAKCKIPVIGLELCAEAMLDIEYIKGVGGTIPLTDLFNAQYSLETWAKQVQGLSPKVLIHSVSYGNDEIQQTGDAFIQACNIQFMQFGSLGISVLFASGDQGVYGRTGPGKKRFNPDFPAGSPYITAVGGTDFVTKSVVGPEKAWTNGGGGFSDHFPIPSYQSDAVATYKKDCKLLPEQSLWNNTGRGYPDVAALGGQGNAYCIAVSKALAGVAGTSASCPVVAGVFGKLNEVRLGAGKVPMGFLNPFIYQNPTGFNDVKEGDNRGAGLKGFLAIKGWDPATGMGSPNYEELAKLV